MMNQHLAHQRLYTQHIAGTPFKTPVEVVRYLTAVQSQDYSGGKWALGLRTQGVTDAEIEQECNNGTILRTHVMRPTWHFVLPEDIGWMLALTAPRVRAKMAHTFRINGLSDADFSKSKDVLIKQLRGKQFTRAEVTEVFNRAGISTEALPFTLLMIDAELDGIICSGAWRGKQPTYALLDERAPNARKLSEDEALAELTRRYFTSHGPAQIKDYVWWSGLTMSQAKAGIEMVKSELRSEVIDGQTYWSGDPVSLPKTAAKDMAATAYLLPNYDEYIVAYADRTAIYDAQQHVDKLDSRGNALFNHTIVINGEIVGTWKRTFKKNAVLIELQLFVSLSDDQMQAITAAAQRYADYHGTSLYPIRPN